MQKNTFLLVVPAAALALQTSPLRAEERNPGTRLEEVVVTATKTAKDVSESPAAVSVVTTTDIDTGNVHSADEALRFLPGVYASRAGGHEPSVMGTNILLRGIPDYSRTLVLVDGQTLNDPYIGAVTWESVPPETIERIEVVPGPFSSLYGGSAMGGVINIITKVPTKKEVTVKTGAGSDGLKSGTLVYQDRLSARTGVIFDLGYKASGGYVKDEVVRAATNGAAGTPVTGWERTTDPYGNTLYSVGDKGDSPWRSYNAGVRLFFDPTQGSRLALGMSRFSYDKQWDRYHSHVDDAAGRPVSSGNITFNDAGTNRSLALSESSFLNGPNPKVQNRYTLEYDTRLTGGADVKATLGYLDIPVYDYVIPKPGATYDGGGPGSRLHRPNSELSASTQIGLPLATSHYLVAGVAGGRRAIKTYQYVIGDWRDADATGTTENRTNGEDRYYALFVQDEMTLNDRLTAYFGGRYDYWTTEGSIEQVKTPASIKEYAARSQSYFSPKVSLVYRAPLKTVLRASAGSAFHPPVLRDTFGWWTPATGKTYLPNPDLKPETVTSWELGMEQPFGAGALFRATYYENRLKDLIYRTEDAATQSIANAGRALVKGLELEVRQPLTRGLTAFANFTYNSARITSNPAKPATEGKRMTRTPQTMVNIGVHGRHGPWSGSLKGHYAGKVYANDENLDTVNGVYGAYDPYFVVDAKVSYLLRKGVTLSLSMDNLLDREYYQSTRAQGRAFFGEIAFQF